MSAHPTVLNDQRERVPCPDYYEEQGGTCQRLDNFYCDGCPDRGKRTPPISLKDADFAQVEARVIFMTGFERGCASVGCKFDVNEGQRSFADYVKQYGPQK